MKYVPQVGDIVQSLAGHDCGRLYAVVAVVGDGYVLIADGESRKLETPKLKNARHLKQAAQVQALTSAIEEGSADDKVIADSIACVKGGFNV